MQSPAYGHYTAHAGGEYQNQKQPKEKDDATQEVADTEAGVIRRAPQLQSIHALHVRLRNAPGSHPYRSRPSLMRLNPRACVHAAPGDACAHIELPLINARSALPGSVATLHACSYSLFPASIEGRLLREPSSIMIIRPSGENGRAPAVLRFELPHLNLSQRGTHGPIRCRTGRRTTRKREYSCRSQECAAKSLAVREKPITRPQLCRSARLQTRVFLARISSNHSKGSQLSGPVTGKWRYVVCGTCFADSRRILSSCRLRMGVRRQISKSTRHASPFTHSIAWAIGEPLCLSQK